MKEANFIYTPSSSIRLRVNVHIQRGNVEATFRIIPSEIKSIRELMLPPILEDIARYNKGIVLIGGVTGSGKTTTLSAMVDQINKEREAVIITLESPIEYVHQNIKSIVKQREIGRDTLSYSEAAKNALRQDPDVIVIGEMLDDETVNVALSAAETGHLVLSSIHAPDTIQVIERILSLYPADMQKYILTRLAYAVKAIIVQQLIPRRDKEGLVPAVEVCIVNTAVRRAIKDGDWNNLSTIIQTSSSLGMQNMQKSISELYNRGLIDVEYVKDYMP